MLLMNNADTPADVAVDWHDVGLDGCRAEGCIVSDLHQPSKTPFIAVHGYIAKGLGSRDSAFLLVGPRH